MSHNNRGEKPRKSLLAVKRSPIAWNRFNLKVISAESKDIIFVKISKALSTGATIGRDIFVGANSVTRLLEKNRAAVVAVCRDSNHNLTDHIIEAARLRNVPIVILPKSSQELASLLKIKRVSCFAISIELDAESSEAELIAKNTRDRIRIENNSKSKKRKMNINVVPLTIENNEGIIGGEDGIMDVENSTEPTEKIESAVSAETLKTKTTESIDVIEKTDDEIAAALNLPAYMDDLRDGMIRMITR